MHLCSRHPIILSHVIMDDYCPVNKLEGGLTNQHTASYSAGECLRRCYCVHTLMLMKRVCRRGNVLGRAERAGKRPQGELSEGGETSGKGNVPGECLASSPIRRTQRENFAALPGKRRRPVQIDLWRRVDEAMEGTAPDERAEVEAESVRSGPVRWH